MKMNTNNNMTWDEALSNYGINFDVHKKPSFIQNDLGQFVENGTFGMVRSDTGNPINGISVKGRYKVIQNSSYADIGNRIVGELGAEFVDGGLLKDGKIAYLQVKMPSTIRVKGTNDVLETNLTFINSFDGSSSFLILPTTRRIVCDNQMAALSRETTSSGLRIRHTASSEGLIKQADRLVLDAMNAFKAFEVKVNFLADQPFTNTQMALAARRIIGVEDGTAEIDMSSQGRKTFSELMRLFVDGNGQGPWRGTSWAALNSVTDYSSHKKLRGSMSRQESNLVGSASRFNAKALNVIENIIAEAA